MIKRLFLLCFFSILDHSAHEDRRVVYRFRSKFINQGDPGGEYSSTSDEDDDDEEENNGNNNKNKNKNNNADNRSRSRGRASSSGSVSGSSRSSFSGRGGKGSNSDATDTESEGDESGCSSGWWSTDDEWWEDALAGKREEVRKRIQRVVGSNVNDNNNNVDANCNNNSNLNRKRQGNRNNSNTTLDATYPMSNHMIIRWGESCWNECVFWRAGQKCDFPGGT